MANIEWDPVKSSNIDAVGYSKDNLDELYIRFKNGVVYCYNKVPDDIYEGLMAAESKGKYFTENIKGVYEYRKV